MQFDPMQLPGIVITQTSPGSGRLDRETGLIEAEIKAAIEAKYSGTVDITVSTAWPTIHPCDGRLNRR